MPDIPQPIIPLKYLMLVTFINKCNLSTFDQSNFVHDNEVSNTEEYNKCTEEIVIVHLPEGFCQWLQYSMNLLPSLAVFCPVFVNTGVFLVFHEVIAIRAPKMAVTSSPFISFLLFFVLGSDSHQQGNEISQIFLDHDSESICANCNCCHR